jgi:hypothetical protein
MRHLLTAALALPLLLGANAARAATCAIDYQVNVPIASNDPSVTPASVTGDICTDGTIGTLAQSDIVSWNLSLSNSWNPQISDYSLSSSLSTATLNLYLNNVASPLSATPTQLTWDFFDPGAGNYAELYFSDSSSNNFVAWDNFHSSGPVTTNSYGNTQTSASYGTPQSGPQLVGTAIPEPASALLLLAGLAALPPLRRRKAA